MPKLAAKGVLFANWIVFINLFNNKNCKSIQIKPEAFYTLIQVNA